MKKEYKIPEIIVDYLLLEDILTVSNELPDQEVEF